MRGQQHELSILLIRLNSKLVVSTGPSMVCAYGLACARAVGSSSMEKSRGLFTSPTNSALGVASGPEGTLPPIGDYAI
jgi:hypothetical protein